MNENFGEPVVNCSSCNKEIPNNKHTRFDHNNVRYFACSGDCKGKVFMKAKRIEKNEQKKIGIKNVLA
jgi:hypothetical protein